MLIVCPKTLKYNWFNEFKKWDTRGARVGIGDTRIVPLPEHGYNICIVNYEAVVKRNKELSAVKWDLIGIDEAHNLKNEKNHRNRSIFGGQCSSKSGEDVKTKSYTPLTFDKVVFATGTPIPNRVMEMWPLISQSDPERWNNNTKWKFISKFCGGNPKGAASDDKLNELQKILRQTIMVRRLKKDVLKELPAKIRQVVELEYSETDSAVKAALARESACSVKNEEEVFNARVRMELAKASDNEDEYRAAVANLTSVASLAFTEMAKARYETAIEKIPYVLEFCDNLLQTTRKILIFAHHKEVLNTIAAHYGTGCMIIHGDVSIKDRQEAVERFQGNVDCRVAVLSISAAGVGITLTASSTVVFAELDWVPGNISQCEDRVLRIGQTADVVNVFQLVLHGSIDANMAHKIIEKQMIIEQTLDKISEQEPVIIGDEPATTSINKARIEAKLKTFDITLIPEIHEGLRIVAGYDEDYARAKNSMGFNMIDCKVGHNLADRFELTPKQAILGMQILKKYRKQIPFNIYYNIFRAEEKLQVEEF